MKYNSPSNILQKDTFMPAFFLQMPFISYNEEDTWVFKIVVNFQWEIKKQVGIFEKISQKCEASDRRQALEVNLWLNELEEHYKAAVR